MKFFIFKFFVLFVLEYINLDLKISFGKFYCNFFKYKGSKYCMVVWEKKILEYIFV